MAGAEMMQRLLVTVGVSAGAFIVSLIAHNAISSWFGVEEPVFFAIAFFLCPLVFWLGIARGVLLTIIRG